MKKGYAAAFGFALLIATTAEASAHYGDWWRATPKLFSIGNRVSSAETPGEIAGGRKVCSIGGYIHWTCRNDQICGNSPGVCR